MRDPRSVLNELCQVGVLREYDSELFESRGPSHRPTFVALARALLPSGDAVRAVEREGPSKKAAQRAAAQALVDQRHGRGYT